ncbi:MAG: response regulator transcription factor [Sphingomonas bacterium]|nr:response regulator transcription factor [Sphingomonas bacterium]
MKLLLVEDDDETAAYLERGLIELGHSVDRMSNGRDALQVSQGRYDVIVLDRMLPEVDGLTVLNAIRTAHVTTPVLMLTALGSIEDRVEGLEAGADDYLAKPFSFAELIARVNALGRRSTVQEQQLLAAGGRICLDRIKREVSRDGQRVSLQPRELRLLEELMLNIDRVVTRTMLLESVWDFHFDPKTNIVETHVSRLRSKLNAGYSDDPIETVRGAGYRINSFA